MPLGPDPSIAITATDIERGLYETVPRDWFAPILPVNGSEDFVVVRRVSPGGFPSGPSGSGGQLRKIAISHTRPSKFIMPAFLKALLAVKLQKLLPSLEAVVRSSRLVSSHEIDLDSYAYQFYGDLITRDEANDEDDEAFRKRIASMFYAVDGNGDGEAFQPRVTRNGVQLLLETFGYHVQIPARSTIGSMKKAFAWNVAKHPNLSGKPTYTQTPHKFGWNRTDLNQCRDGEDIILFITGKGEVGLQSVEGAGLSSHDKAIAEMLVRKAKAVGVVVTVIFPITTSGGAV